MYSSSEHVYRTLDAGAAGYLLKESAASGPARACAATRPGAAAGAYPGGLIQKRHNGSATQAGDPARPAAARTVHIAPKRRHSRAEVGLKQPQSVANSHLVRGQLARSVLGEPRALPRRPANESRQAGIHRARGAHRARAIHVRRVQLIGGGWGARSEHHSLTGLRIGAPLAFSSTTTNLAGSVLLALRPTT